MINKEFFLNFYRRSRVKLKQFFGIEPFLAIQNHLPHEYYGSTYGGWSVPLHWLDQNSVIVDVGLGQDISFSTSLIDRYDCTIHGFDPTPRSIDYVTKLSHPNFHLHKLGLAASCGRAIFHLPNDNSHVSGSLNIADHIGRQNIEVELINLDELLRIIDRDHINLLKLDIEGSEYEIFLSPSFERLAPRIDIICVEFHHRWPEYGVKATKLAVNRLNELGFLCIWINDATNEEYTFVRSNLIDKHRYD
jgi:FkbM family methyltransferase